MDMKYKQCRLNGLPVNEAAIVILAATKRKEILACAWRFFAIKLNFYISQVCMKCYGLIRRELVGKAARLGYHLVGDERNQKLTKNSTESK